MKNSEEKNMKALSMDELELVSGGDLPDMGPGLKLLEEILKWFD